MYSYIPKRKNALGIIISAVLFTFVIILVVANIHNGGDFGSVSYLASLLLFILGMLIFARYVFCSYEYTFDGDTFTVYERRFKRSAVCARLNLFEIDEVISVKKRRDAKKNEYACRVYDYRPDLFPRSYHIVITRNKNYCKEDEEMRILVQLDERLLTMLIKK